MTIKGKSLSRFEKNSQIQPEGCKLVLRRKTFLSGGGEFLADESKKELMRK